MWTRASGLHKQGDAHRQSCLVLEEVARGGHGGHTVVLYGCFRRFLKKRSVPARLRSRAIRVIDALSGPLMPNFLGRPGGRRVRLNAFRSSGRMAHTVPTLIPYSRCLVSSRRT